MKNFKFLALVYMFLLLAGCGNEKEAVKPTKATTTFEADNQRGGTCPRQSASFSTIDTELESVINCPISMQCSGASGTFYNPPVDFYYGSIYKTFTVAEQDAIIAQANYYAQNPPVPPTCTNYTYKLDFYTLSYPETFDGVLRVRITYYCCP